jgi:hypothetical protein
MSEQARRPLPQRQPDDEPVSLGDLMQSAARLPEPLQEPELPLPERKRKPKPRLRPMMLPRTVTMPIMIFASALLLALATAFLIVAPVSVVRETDVESVLEIAPVMPVANPAESQPVTSDPSELIGHWLVTAQSLGSIPAGTYVMVLSLDATSREWLNVADMDGNLALALPESLWLPAVEPSPALSPPVGPFADAIDSLDKRVRLLEPHGVFAAGTEVYISGWRAEDGLWIYEVTLDGTHVEFVPSAFLEWVD